MRTNLLFVRSGKFRIDAGRLSMVIRILFYPIVSPAWARLLLVRLSRILIKDSGSPSQTTWGKLRILDVLLLGTKPPIWSWMNPVLGNLWDLSRQNSWLSFGRMNSASLSSGPHLRRTLLGQTRQLWELLKLPKISGSAGSLTRGRSLRAELSDDELALDMPRTWNGKALSA